MKCNQSRQGFELVSPCPFPTTITITPQAPPFFIEIYLSLFIRESVNVSVLCERWVERHILRERASSHIFFREPWECQRLDPLSSWDTSDRLHVSHSTVILCTLSKSDRVVLITWSPCGYTPVVPDCPDRAVIFSITNQNVTACQSTRGHYERTENPFHMLYNTDITMSIFYGDNHYTITPVVHIDPLGVNIIWTGWIEA